MPTRDGVSEDHSQIKHENARRAHRRLILRPLDRRDVDEGRVGSREITFGR